MKKLISYLTLIAGCLPIISSASIAPAFATASPPAPLPHLDSLLYGAAYYYEYIPYERLDKDIALMKAAGINTVRLAESTWATWEPHDNVFDFTKLDHVLDGMDKAGIHVIVGTPTYAIPVWLARAYPEVLVTTPTGKRKYGARQNMDIVSPVFRSYAERIIKKLVSHVRDRRCVIGYQTDNETKSYQNTGVPIQTLFVQWLQKKFGSPENMNKAYGLDYWSNAIHDWKDFPDITGNVNASLGCAFASFQRKMVTEYLAWQVALIRSLKRSDQFITHNFDLEWRGASYGIQPDVDHFAAARAFDIAGIDIYHPTADRLTGAEISFGGDLARGMRRSNYLVMETQAQSMAGRQELPYPGQLRLQAFSHLASGANMVEYWPWQSIPNSVETYWKGILSHDGEPNPLYEEVKQTGADFKNIGDHLVDLKIKNKVAILFSNESLTALDWFPFSDSLNYNDLLRREYDALYEMNIGVDMVNTSSTNLDEYNLLIIPPLYSVSDSMLIRLNTYVRNGGHIVYSCKSGFTDENVQVRPTHQPGLLRGSAGISYQLFTNIGQLPLITDSTTTSDPSFTAHDWAEMLIPETAHTLVRYDHPWWGKYAAITQNDYGKGWIIYQGTILSKAALKKLLQQAVKEANVITEDETLSFPLITKHGINKHGHTIRYYFNYSGETHSFSYPHHPATDLLTGVTITTGQSTTLKPWGFIILEEASSFGLTFSTTHHSSLRTASSPGNISSPNAISQQLPPDSINAHGAGVLYDNGIYYLFGEVKKGPTHLVPGQDWEDYRVDAGGISCYVSKDLVHWEYKGLALAPDKNDTGSDLHIRRVIERPKVIYNASTKQYVMWMHIDREDYGYARAGVAVSDKPEGPYRYIRSIRPDGQMSRDMTLFKDEDGKAYLIYTSENNNTMHIALLSKDYLSATGTYKRILIGQRREAPAVFVYRKKYYLITSLCSGWDPNAAIYATADSMLGEWRQKGNPCVGIDAENTFHSQSTFVLPLHDSTFLFMADRWNKTDLERSTYLWLPFHVNNGNVQISSPVLKKLDTHPLTIVNYNIHILPSSIKDNDIKGRSALRFYDTRDSLLLECTVPFTLTDSGANTGNYTEAPPLTQYLTISIETASGSPVPPAADCQVQLLKDPTQSSPAPQCSIDEYLRPFWRSDTIVNETVLLLAKTQNTPVTHLVTRTNPSSHSPNSGPASRSIYSAFPPSALATGQLLFTPDKILSVKNFSLDTTYQKNIDYLIKGRTLIRQKGSHMPYKTDTSFDTKNDLAWYNLQSQWVTVTYTHHDPWPGPIPSYKGQDLPGLRQKLTTNQPITIVAYGMSITRGMDVSSYDSVPPYMPSYIDLFTIGLKKYYPQGNFKLYNAALPGATLNWAAQYANQYVNPLHPDLVVLDFGMNDFWRMAPDEFKDSIQSIMTTIKKRNPAAEFLLLANMKFDPDYILDTDKNKTFYKNNFAGYQRALKSLEGKGIISLDMTSLSDAIYQRKKAKDCIVNPLHPNDYMARWYAQGLLALLCP